MTACPDCGVAPGQLHVDGCDVERCSECGRQRIGCDCDARLRMQWTGEWPGLEDCRRLGWFTARGDEDLNRLVMTARWNKVDRRWEKPCKS